MKSGRLQDRNPKELQSASKEAKFLWSKRGQLRIRGDELFFLAEDNIYKWIVPASERKRLVFSVHKGFGHIGLTKTIHQLKEQFYWPNMDYEIRILLNTCKPCQERKSAGARALPQQQITVTSYPFEKIALDITGPLKPCKSGERYILGMIDYFTKFPLLIPLHNIESRTVARAVFQNWICLFGAPIAIHSDRGTAFESALFHELCDITGITKTKTAPFYPKSDGLIERLFSTVKDMIFATTRSSSMDWKDALPIISMGLRSTIQRATRVSPFEALFGHKMRTPMCWEYPTYIENSADHHKNAKSHERLLTSEYIIDLNYNLKQIHKKINETMELKTGLVSEHFVTPLPVGTHVMARILPVTKGVDKPRYSGPYVIIKHLGPWTYRLEHCVSKEIVERNIHHVKRTAVQAAQSSINPLHHSRNQSNLEETKKCSQSKRRCHSPLRYGFKSCKFYF